MRALELKNKKSRGIILHYPLDKVKEISTAIAGERFDEDTIKENGLRSDDPIFTVIFNDRDETFKLNDWIISFE